MFGDIRIGFGLPQHQRQRAGCLAQHAADAEQIADLRAGPNQRLPGRHAAEHGDGQAQRATGGIAANQTQAAVERHGIQSAGELGEPERIAARQAQGKGEADGCGAHAGQVAGGDGQGALAEQERIAGIGEMHAGDQGVGGHGQLFTGGNLQQGAIIADAENDFAAGPGASGGGEVVTDQLELTQQGERPSALVVAHFGAAQRGGQLVQHTVDELVSVGGAVDLGQLDAFVDDHAVRHVDALHQLVG